MDVGIPWLDELLANGLLVASSVDGVYIRSARFDSVVDALDNLVGRTGAVDSPEVFRFPPAMPTAALVRSGYVKSFPQLLGTIHSFCGDEAAHRSVLRCIDANEPWTDHQEATGLLLTPAACYPLYPVIAERGPLSAAGGLYDMHSWCFRHEPSRDPARMQTFRVREFVRIGSEQQVLEFRAVWLERARALIDELSLPYEVDVAHDPFFGRTGRLLAGSQREQKLKYELLVPINDGLQPTACASFNYHMTHFAEAWHISIHDGNRAHSGCVGFGLERIALALFKNHGLDCSAWPEQIAKTLRLTIC